jgi:hypothetical protein
MKARRLAAVLAASIGGLLWPATATAHQLSERYAAPLPLLVYVAGAALAVAASFAFVMLRGRVMPTTRAAITAHLRLPRWLQLLLHAVGLLAWLWIVAQTIVGGSGEADVASLFLWVYGWVGVALFCALIGPLWSYLDPFSTLHRLLGWLAARLGLGSGAGTVVYPERLGRWPAVVGFGVIVWLELVGRVDGGRTLGLVLVGYTVYTLAGMSLFGRATWRSQAEAFSVWFGALGRLAPYAHDGDAETGNLVRRPFGAGLQGGWSTAEVVLVGIGTGSIIFDGLSQTQLYFDALVLNSPLGLERVIVDTVAGTVLIGGLILALLAVARRLGTDAIGAGLLPVAVGYLAAHYLTFLLYDGQRIVNALNDPLQRGDNLLPPGLAFFQPVAFLPAALVWTLQLGAVVGGHITGAWAGHAALTGSDRRSMLRRQLPLATLMVTLTSITLWSLGQAVIVAAGE